MNSDLDIYQTANELIKQHGDDAPIHADIPAHFAMLICGPAREPATIGSKS